MNLRGSIVLRDPECHLKQFVSQFQAQGVAEGINKFELTEDPCNLNGTATTENQPTQKLSKAAKRMV